MPLENEEEERERERKGFEDKKGQRKMGGRRKKDVWTVLKKCEYIKDGVFLVFMEKY